MTALQSLQPFHPHLPDAAGVISWIHIGDLHMAEAGEQNHLDSFTSPAMLRITGAQQNTKWCAEQPTSF